MRTLSPLAVALVAAIAYPFATHAADNVKVGLNYPKTGPYFSEGLDQIRAATLAVEEINEAGGVLGRKVELAIRDSMSKVPITKTNVTELIEKENVKMVFGGSASNVAIAAGEICQEKGVIYFGTLTYSNDTTGKDGHRHTFRECYNAWMASAALAKTLKKSFAGKKFFYVTSNYSWGWTTESSMRKFSGTEDVSVHKQVLTPFPNARLTDFKNALRAAQNEKPDVLVLVLFGQDMVKAVNEVGKMGLKNTMQVVVPNLEEHMAEGVGPRNMAGIIGALPWTWRVPYKFGYSNGIKFVEKFAARYGRYPSTSGASAYTILYEWKNAVELAQAFDSPKVIKALEGRSYTSLKDVQTWRDFDHQSVQTVYVVKGNPPEVVDKDKYRMDYFDVIDSMSGEEAAMSRKEWEASRTAAGKPTILEALPAN
jgi:branched-chain amino acid transport system substrate-binding protein